MNRRNFMKLIAVVVAAPCSTLLNAEEYTPHLKHLLPDRHGIKVTSLGVHVVDGYKLLRYKLLCEKTGAEGYCEIDCTLLSLIADEEHHRRFISMELEAVVEAIIEYRKTI